MGKAWTSASHLFNLMCAHCLCLVQRSPNFFVRVPHKLLVYHTTVRGPHIVRSVIVSGYVTFYQINKFFVNISIFIFDRMSAGGWKWLRRPYLPRGP